MLFLFFHDSKKITNQAIDKRSSKTYPCWSDGKL